jgi:hypothetical protein
MKHVVQGRDRRADAQPACRERDDHGDQPAEQHFAGEREQQHLHADQHEQHGVEDLVDEFPEHVDVLARGVRHRHRAAAVADHDAGDDHRERTRDVQVRGQRVPADPGGQRRQHLHLVLVDRFEQAVGRVAEQPAEGEAAAGFAQQQQPAFTGRRRAALHDGRHQREQHHADAVVEQRLAADDDLQVARRVGRFHDRDHRHRIGRRNQRAKEQAVRQWQCQARQGQRVPHAGTDDQRRSDRPDHGQAGDLPPMAAQLRQLHMHRPREQQQRQHALQQHLAEVDRAHERLRHRARRVGEAGRVQPADRERHDERDRHHAHGGRQPDEAMVEVREQGGGRETDGDDVQHAGRHPTCADAVMGRSRGTCVLVGCGRHCYGAPP